MFEMKLVCKMHRQWKRLEKAKSRKQKRRIKARPPTVNNCHIQREPHKNRSAKLSTIYMPIKKFPKRKTELFPNGKNRFLWWTLTDSNRWPFARQANALPAELNVLERLRLYNKRTQKASLFFIFLKLFFIGNFHVIYGKNGPSADELLISKGRDIKASPVSGRWQNLWFWRRGCNVQRIVF